MSHTDPGGAGPCKDPDGEQTYCVRETTKCFVGYSKVTEEYHVASYMYCSHEGKPRDAGNRRAVCRGGSTAGLLNLWVMTPFTGLHVRYPACQTFALQFIVVAKLWL